jgi:hypothetical protein
MALMVVPEPRQTDAAGGVIPTIGGACTSIASVATAAAEQPTLSVTTSLA